jgi:hypothetical protein
MCRIRFWAALVQGRALQDQVGIWLCSRDEHEVWPHPTASAGGSLRLNRFAASICSAGGDAAAPRAVTNPPDG